MCLSLSLKSSSIEFTGCGNARQLRLDHATMSILCQISMVISRLVVFVEALQSPRVWDQLVSRIAFVNGTTGDIDWREVIV